MGIIIQFCGLSGAGKTTLAEGLLMDFQKENLKVKVIDGDVYRKTLCKDLGFSKEDRMENIYRLSALAHTLKEDYDFIILALINPFQEAREQITLKYEAPLIWLKCDLPTLIERDTKGLYRKALLPDHHQDKIHNLTGVNDTFDQPTNVSLIIETSKLNLEESLYELKGFLKTLL